jgi:hypothetical protein
MFKIIRSVTFSVIIAFTINSVGITSNPTTPNGASDTPAANSITLDAFVKEMHDAEIELEAINKANSDTLQLSVPAQLHNAVITQWDRIKNSIEKEAERYSAQFTVGPNGQVINSAETVGFSSYYQFGVEPAFNGADQLRRDVYVFGLGTRTHLIANLEARVTFSRIFKGDRAKSHALKAIPYWPSRIPLSTEDILSKLKDGDGVRFEFFGAAGAGTGHSLGVGSKGTGSVSASLTREALFMVDVYRHSDSLIRVRALGLKNRGSLKGSASVGLDVAQNLAGPLKRIFNRFITFKLGVDAGINPTILDQFPVDTMMVDYLYNLSAPASLNTTHQLKLPETTAKGGDALNELIHAIRSFGFTTLFNPFASGGQVADALLANTTLSESLALKDLNRALTQRRVRHLFKGQLSTATGSIQVGGQFSDLIKKSSETGGVTSFVKSVREDGTIDFYLFENSYIRSDFRAVLGRFQDTKTNNVDFVLESNKDADAGKVIDLIVRTEGKEKSWDRKEIQTFQDKIRNSLPETIRNTTDISPYFPDGERTNVTYSYQFSFGKEALDVIKRIDRITFISDLYDFFENHPEKRYMNLSTDEKRDNPYIFGYVETLGTEVSRMLGQDTSPKLQLEAFTRLKNNPVFRDWVLGQFFAKSINTPKALDLFQLEMQISSEPKVLRIGNHAPSPVYRTVSLLRTILAERSLDLHLETLKSTNGGEDVIFSPQLQPLLLLQNGHTN